MICGRELFLALAILLGSSLPSGAQTVVNPSATSATVYGDYHYRIEPFGGFGFESMQVPVVGAVWLDRFGLLHETEPVPPSAVMAERARSKTTNRATPGRTTKSRTRLPTGSLTWPGDGDVVLYSPGFRYQSYGGGYARGPYGSADCGMMYHGMRLGY